MWHLEASGILLCPPGTYLFIWPGESCGGGVEASPSESLVGWVREAPVGSCSFCVGVPTLSLSSEVAGVGITLGKQNLGKY